MRGTAVWLLAGLFLAAPFVRAEAPGSVATSAVTPSATPAAAGDTSGERRSPIMDPKRLVAAARELIREVEADELAGRLAPDSILIDVREPEEFADGHIFGAVNIPRGRLEFDVLKHPELARLAEDDPAALADREIVLYCRSGGRGALAAQSLQSMGFDKVLSLRGGYRAWQEFESAPDPGPASDPAPDPTQ